jgi:hypothetical protein
MRGLKIITAILAMWVVHDVAMFAANQRWNTACRQRQQPRRISLRGSPF